MPVLFNSNTGSNSWQAFAVPQGLPRPEVADVAAARNYRPIGREFQGYQTSQASHESGTVAYSIVFGVMLRSPAHFGVAPQVCDYLNNK
jgi:hypothetical protein